MVFPVVGGDGKPTGYEIDKSLRLEDGDSPHLELAHGADGNTKTFTYSWWFKQGNITINRNFFGHSSVDDQILLKDDDRMQFSVNNSADARFVTNQVFRDVSAWYHCVIAVDTTQSTNTNRVKIYINGTQVTSFDTANYPDQNYDFTGFNTDTNNQYVGRERGGNYFDGYMSEIYFIDGQALAPSSFGETNDNGVWIPKDAKDDLTFGNNGYYLEFKQTGTSQNSSGIGADTSGNDNHFAVTNLAAIDVTTDTPTNNFCTMSPLYSYSGITFSEGNLQTNLGGSNHRWGTSTFFVANGKWYFECKLLSDSNYNSGPGVIAYGIDDPITTEGGGAGSKAEGWIYLSTSAGDLQHGGTQYGTADAATTNDILMVAFDVDNGKIWIGKNGTWSEGSNPSTGNGAVREDLGDASSGLFSPGVSGYAENMVFNFGNPPFSISSGNADANGYGNFEYAVPSGFYSLCTKNLAEYG